MIGGVEMIQFLPYSLYLFATRPQWPSDFIGIKSGIPFSAINIGGMSCHWVRGAIIRTAKDKIS